MVKKKQHKCPVCGKHVFPFVGSYETCPVCFWEDDIAQYQEPDSDIGANEMSLKDYKAKWFREQKDNKKIF